MPGKKPEPEKDPGPSFARNHQLEARRLKARLQYQLEMLEGAREERKVVALESIADSLISIVNHVQETNRLIAEQNKLHGNRNETLKKKFE